MNSEHHWRRRKLLKIPLILVAIAGFIAIKGYVAMLLWNGLIPELFHGPELKWVQVIGLIVLAKLFIGFGFGGWRHHHHGRHHRFGRHWAKLSKEERAQMKEELRKRWHDHHDD
jgi:hypothetical protein